MSENLNLKTISTIDPSPFRHLCVTIGELPSAFIESMSYYELLAWFVNYLENTVIPAVNANGEATAELQEMFIELKTFVDDYFDNLDVQEEINNKLDEMAEEGTLQEIITSYIQSNVAWTFDTVADMKLATNLVAGSYAKTLGFRSINDGGGALYYITNSGTADESKIIAIDNLYANIVTEAVMKPEQFGAYGTGTNDDTLYIQNCLDTAKTVILEKTYLTTSALLPKSGQNIIGRGGIITSATSINIIRSEEKNNIKIEGLKIIGSAVATDGQIGISFRDCSDCEVENVIIEDTGGDGVFMSGCTRCELKNARLKNNLISAIAYNSNLITFTNIDVYKPRFQYGIQFKSCNSCLMDNVKVDTPKDIGIFVNKGLEEGSNDTADIMLNNVTVLNQGQDGTITESLRYGIAITNGSRMNINNAYVTNSANNGIAIYSSNSRISNSTVSNNTWGGLGINNVNDVTVEGCNFSSNGNNGISAVSTNNVIISGCVLYNNGDSTSEANIKLDTTTNSVINNNVMTVPLTDTSRVNLLTVTSCSGLRVIGNTFINPNTSASYADYRGVYDTENSVFKCNGSCRFYQLRGLSIRCTAEWDNGGVIISDFATSIPSYNNFIAGDKFLNKSGSGYVGWIYDGTAWHGYGAIAS